MNVAAAPGMTFWIAFHAAIAVFLLLDLFVFHRKSHVVTMKEAAWTSAFWVSIALAFNAWLWWWRGPDFALVFLSAYLLEKSLSMDNLFVFYLLFRQFRIPREGEHRLLFYGVVGAIVMRAVLILVGVGLVNKFEFLFYVFGAFLIYSGVKMWSHAASDDEAEENRVIAFLRRILPVAKEKHPGFLAREGGRIVLTTGAFALVAIEVTDLIFAIDSIPAVVGLTRDFFTAYTSNIMAILGLRALYFLLADLIEKFKRLHFGLSFVLIFIGAKMMIIDFFHVPVVFSLSVILVAVGLPIWLDLKDGEKN